MVIKYNANVISYNNGKVQFRSRDVESGEGKVNKIMMVSL